MKLIKRNNNNLSQGSELVGGIIRVIMDKNMFLMGSFERG